MVPAVANMLTIKPAAEDVRLAKAVYAQFLAKPGSEHIAGVSTLAHVSALLRTRTIKSVLECGSGIGTISYLMLKRLPADARIVGTEQFEWCRHQFDQNIPADERARVELLPQGSPEISETFDLVIVDGPVPPGSDFVREGTVCLLDGGRQGTFASIRESLADRGLDCHLTLCRGYGFRLKCLRTRFRIRLPYKIRRNKDGSLKVKQLKLGFKFTWPYKILAGKPCSIGLVTAR
jgi:hypothetical protein